jgi:adenylate kinase
MPQPHERTTWLHGDLFRCWHPPVTSGRALRLVLLGPPGVGKGTQAELLAAALGACPLSTGDVFRAAHETSQAPGSAMAEAQGRIDRGELVPDDIVLSVIRNRRQCLRCHVGFLLDGFPRTMAQAIALDGMLAVERLQLDAVISYDLPVGELVQRMAGRRVCAHCGALYHIAKRPPRRPGVCDLCGRALVLRTDDEPAAIRARIDAYAVATAQVADYYRRQGLLLPVRADEEPERIFARTLDALSARGMAVPARAAG